MDCFIRKQAVLFITFFAVLNLWLITDAKAGINEPKKDMEFIVSPYLIKPGTDTMTIMFESYCVFPKVFFREKGQVNYKSLQASFLPLLPTIRKAKLVNLKSNTEYEYYVATPLRKSEKYNFKTWPRESDEIDSVKLVAISDSQGNHPERLADVITNGILKKEANSSPQLAGRQISGILVTGDLVSDGNSKEQWVDEFFKNMHPLISHVPILPALGNHDMLPFLYSCYFDLLPDSSGTINDPRFYYRVDILNTAIITLNSNDLLDIENVNDYDDFLQRLWLDEQLADIASAPHLDFMIAQFHHPCKSELWTPGNTERSCDYVAKFEKFTAETGKPSFHLFGHTHAYSRGQSRDVTHLWVNVASTAGALDNWGEFEMEDYDEFQKSYDEYGYSMISIKRGHTPEVRMIRRTGGSDTTYFGYSEDSIRDDFTISLGNTSPDKPEISCTVSNEEVIVSGTPFADPDGNFHLETHWQVSKTEAFDDIVENIWGNKTRFENIWYGDNIQEGVDITKYSIKGLDPEIIYHARVRYRDSGFKWSDWSVPCLIKLKE